MTIWEPVIGLEVHVQLGTNTKAFSSSASVYGKSPNSLTDPTVLGLPGCLPVFNKNALTYAIRLGLATGSTIRRVSRFARKHYFYPDLPKGYQISQFDEPICEQGQVEFLYQGNPHSVRLTRIHLEEDAGKNTHQMGATSLVDLNRAGTPLCEIVSEPDIRSAEEAAEYMRAIRQLVRYLGISEGNMEEGHLRCDANVSLRPQGQEKFGTRTELKNINSFRFVQKAIEHEIRRQSRILDDGGTIQQQTRLWDANAGVSQAMRSKEEANDYRYFPDPDLPPLVVSEEALQQEEEVLPELPLAKYKRYVSSLGLSPADAKNLSAERDIADYFDEAVDAYGKKAGAKPLSNWIQSELTRELNKEGLTPSQCKIAPKDMAQLVMLIEDQTISGKIAKDVFGDMFVTGNNPQDIVKEKGLTQISDESVIVEICGKVVEASPEQAAQYKAGKTGLLGFFVGQVMKQTQGKANPSLVNQQLRKILEA